MFVIDFVDDILLYSKNKEEHVEHLETVSRLLREHQLHAKLSNYSFFQTEVHYLAHVVYKEGITMDPEKIKFIMEWPSIRNVDGVSLKD